MSPQPHIIRREVLRVRVSGAEVARTLLPRLSDIAARPMPQILERCLDAAAAEDQPERIDRLEVDIGHLRLAFIEQDMVVGLERELPVALAKALSSARSKLASDLVPTEAMASSPARKSALALEAIATFARTGRLPWWRSGWREVSLAVVMREAGDAGAPALAELLRSLARDGEPFERTPPA
jgi:hypothetical protein